jgi:hypothetical protein
MAKNVMSVTFSFIDATSLSLTCCIQVDTYEVLVEVNLPTRWVYQSLLPRLPGARPLDGTSVPLASAPRAPPPQVTLR